MSITTTATLLTRQETAQLLGVSERRVTALCQAGDLEFIADGRKGVLIIADSAQRQARWTGEGGRPYSAHMAFAALYLISELPAPWITRQQLYRLKGYLHETGAENLARLTRRRAQTIGYWCRDSRLESLAANIRVSSATGNIAERFDLMPTETIEGYITTGQVESIIHRFRLKQGVRPTKVRLHIADFLPDGQGTMPIGVCAADLAESNDPRERRAGLETLTELITAYNKENGQ